MLFAQKGTVQALPVFRVRALGRINNIILSFISDSPHIVVALRLYTALLTGFDIIVGPKGLLLLFSRRSHARLKRVIFTHIYWDLYLHTIFVSRPRDIILCTRPVQ